MSNVMLTPNFSRSEAVATSAPYKNEPTEAEWAVIEKTAQQMEMVRKILGAPISPSSWFRAPKVNAHVGGGSTSAHLKGFAVDFKCPVFGTPTEVVAKLAASGIKFDQLIDEKDGAARWVHISFDPRLRGQVLKIYK